METSLGDKVNICKNCHGAFDRHSFILKLCPDNLPASGFWRNCEYTAMDNLDYIEHLAKQRNLV
jgi:hypothetical protein